MSDGYATPDVVVKSARKPHICDWCGTRILIGESYVKWCWIYDKATTVRAHCECLAAFRDGYEFDGCDYFDRHQERPTEDVYDAICGRQ